MKSRLHRIEITNFKAFREFELDLEGRHLLVYGANVSGKSSLYWALYTFLQSAGKPTAGVVKYFDPADPHNLLNIHEQLQPNPEPGEIALTVRDSTTRQATRYPISKSDHSTFNDRAILKADLASDFVTYRIFFGFSNFRHSQRFDLWPLFETEILPFPALIFFAVRGPKSPFFPSNRCIQFVFVMHDCPSILESHQTLHQLSHGEYLNENSRGFLLAPPLRLSPVRRLTGERVGKFACMTVRVLPSRGEA